VCVASGFPIATGKHTLVTATGAFDLSFVDRALQLRCARGSFGQRVPHADMLAARRVPTDRFADGVPGAGREPSAWVMTNASSAAASRVSPATRLQRSQLIWVTANRLIEAAAATAAASQRAAAAGRPGGCRQNAGRLPPRQGGCCPATEAAAAWWQGSSRLGRAAAAQEPGSSRRTTLGCCATLVRMLPIFLFFACSPLTSRSTAP
jgi:hypothetical protein